MTRHFRTASPLLQDFFWLPINLLYLLPFTRNDHSFFLLLSLRGRSVPPAVSPRGAAGRELHPEQAWERSGSEQRVEWVAHTCWCMARVCHVCSVYTERWWLTCQISSLCPGRRSTPSQRGMENKIPPTQYPVFKTFSNAPNVSTAFLNFSLL